MRRIALALLVTLSGACGSTTTPSDAQPPPAGAAATAPVAASASASTATTGYGVCGIAPMSLELVPPEGRPHALLDLEPDGSLHVHGFGSSLEARIDAKGCLHGPDGLWAELTPSGALWTPHELLRAEPDALRMPNGVRHVFATDGSVMRVEADGTRGTREYGGVRFRGYGRSAHCSAVLMYAAMLSMMPSMAVVDGVARRAPPPPDSRCTPPKPAGIDLAIPSKLPTIRTQGMGCGGNGPANPDHCEVRIPLDRDEVHPGAPPAPARLFQVVLHAGIAARLVRDDALTTVAVVLEGSLRARPDDGAESQGSTDDRGRPLETRSLERGAGFRAVGGGVELFAERDVTLLVAQVLRRDRARFVERGQPWKKRPGAAEDGFERFDLASAPRLAWGEGRFAAAIALEGGVRDETHWHVPADPPPGVDKRTAPLPTEPVPASKRVTRAPDASLTLLGIAGGASVPEHVHDDAWELLTILQGSGTMTLGAGDTKRTIDVRPGAALRIPRGVPHSFVAAAGEPVIAVQLYTPPGAEQRFKKLAGK
jgi:quercetin dioxygenase-like cupin family protein